MDAMITFAAVAQVCGLLGLWMRLRWRTRQTQAERRYLDGLSNVAAGGHSWEVDEQQADGKRLRIRVTAASHDGSNAA
ncbi:hypothetical protein ABZX98_32510 [Streptomyces sp. NPDC002992]|uniref:hypothetical protein n=1 Tax=Streptomyces sp. NPDC002992 TaxID=3154273 RepID=UPI0033B0A7F0